LTTGKEERNTRVPNPWSKKC